MTCCGVCSSLRGAAYYVTSVQIFIGLYLFNNWVVMSVIKGLHADYFEDSRKQILYPILLVYITLFVLLGCINFLAVQNESGKVMQWTTRLLLVLQLLELGSHLVLGIYLPDEENDDADMTRTRALVNGTYPSRKEKKNFEIEDRYYDPPKVPRENEDNKKNKNKKAKKNKQDKPTIEIEESATLRPSAPPPTPGPSQNEEDYEDIDSDGKEPEYIDAECDEDVSNNQNIYVAGPDKKNLRL
ncbi:C-mannosyltransferase dpy-19 [Folsomia candida]|uniref:C-mannosyltransferase dpy-19 n=1 Tax=Folsomia candida TaxID=158441 RepID=A0A226DQZ8_FOLCA|nr:C-mannosyltransferase dpy-19 [Folsomia candida]